MYCLKICVLQLLKKLYLALVDNISSDCHTRFARVVINLTVPPCSSKISVFSVLKIVYICLKFMKI